MVRARKPTLDEIRSSSGKTVPDLISSGLHILFSGINPSLYSAAVGLHFARPGNRFWPALHRAGFTPRLFTPSEGVELLSLGYGITNLVDRSTASADELSVSELVEGGRCLEGKVRRYAPRIVAFLGISSYRSAFGRPRATIGLQAESIGQSALWVLPNPSGLNAHYRLSDLINLYGELKRAGELPRAGLDHSGVL